MKKTYVFPRAEKMAFDYSDTVVASSFKPCTLEAVMADSGIYIIDGKCTQTDTGRRMWVGDQA